MIPLRRCAAQPGGILEQYHHPYLVWICFKIMLQDPAHGLEVDETECTKVEGFDTELFTDEPSFQPHEARGIAEKKNFRFLPPQRRLCLVNEDRLVRVERVARTRKNSRRDAAMHEERKNDS